MREMGQIGSEPQPYYLLPEWKQVRLLQSPPLVIKRVIEEFIEIELISSNTPCPLYEREDSFGQYLACRTEGPRKGGRETTAVRYGICIHLSNVLDF
jgi:hypothetical protein